VTEATHITIPSEKTERAAVDALGVCSGGISRPCSICGAPLTGRQQSACSDRCRAAKSRRERTAAQTERDRQIRELLERALATLHDNR